MRKLLTLVLSLLLTISLLNNTCSHVHNENCGYDETTETGCTHECNEDCLEIDPYIGLGPDDGHI